MVTALVTTLLLAGWPGEEMPLPLTVKTPEDLAFKSSAEKQYLIFNLMVAGRLSYERGEYAAAAEKWEKLLEVPELPASIDAAVRPLAIDARKKSGNTSPLPARAEGQGEGKERPVV